MKFVSLLVTVACVCLLCSCQTTTATPTGPDAVTPASVTPSPPAVVKTTPPPASKVCEIGKKPGVKKVIETKMDKGVCTITQDKKMIYKGSKAFCEKKLGEHLAKMTKFGYVCK